MKARRAFRHFMVVALAAPMLLSSAGCVVEHTHPGRRYHDSTTPDDQRDRVDVTISEELYSFCHEGDGPQCGDADGLTTCEIVTADACLGLIGTQFRRPHRVRADATGA